MSVIQCPYCLAPTMNMESYRAHVARCAMNPDNMKPAAPPPADPPANPENPENPQQPDGAAADNQGGNPPVVLEDLTVAKLREMAVGMGLELRADMHKADIVAVILAAQALPTA